MPMQRSPSFTQLDMKFGHEAVNATVNTFRLDQFGFHFSARNGRFETPGLDFFGKKNKMVRLARLF